MRRRDVLSAPGLALGGLLCIAVLALQSTAHGWYRAPLGVTHGIPPPSFIAIVIVATLASGVGVWHEIGRTFVSPSALRRALWCVSLALIGAAVSFVIILTLVLAGMAVSTVREGWDVGNPLMLPAVVAVIALVAAYSTLLPAMPYAAAAGIVFWALSERFAWIGSSGAPHDD